MRLAEYNDPLSPSAISTMSLYSNNGSWHASLFFRSLLVLRRISDQLLLLGSGENDLEALEADRHGLMDDRVRVLA